MGKGYLHQHRGLATFPVKYRAIVLRPFRGEVVDALVSQVTKVCVALIVCISQFIDIAVRIFAYLCSRCTALMQLGFFANVGPLSIFVAKSVCLSLFMCCGLLI